MGIPSQKIGEGKHFFTPYSRELWSKLFQAIGPEKGYPKLVLKFLGLSQINLQDGGQS